MSSVLEKLNLKSQRSSVVIDAPASFEPELATLEGVIVHRDVKAIEVVEFAIAFATTQSQVDSLTRLLAAKAPGDALLWFAYPKGTSKKYKCDFNRDTGWDRLRAAGFDTVRQVAIDEDWTALRFRRVEYIKSSNSSRSGQITPAQGRASKK